MRNNALLMFLICSTALTTAAADQPRLKEVSLKVTVNPSQQYSTPIYGSVDVLPDGLGPYVDGQNNVCASLDTHGDLIVNLSCTGGSASRAFVLSLSSSIAPPTGGINSCNPPATISPSPSNPLAYTNWISTWQAVDKPTAAFQNMKVDGTVYYVRFTIATAFHDGSQPTYYLSYHRTDGLFPDDAALASYAEVRRLSPTQWVVEPVTPSGVSGLPNIAMLIEKTTNTVGHKSSTTSTECGFYRVAFSFTLDQK